MKVTGGPLVRAHALRPHGRLLRQSGLSVLALVAPVSAVLYWLTIPTDSWRPVVAGQVILFAICLLATIAFFRTVIWVDRDGVSERGFLGRVTSYDKSMIGSIVLLDLYESGALDTHPQLFITGVDGRLLVRMRGQFYSRGAMETIVEQLDAPIVRVAEPMTLQDLNRSRPELLYWFERRVTTHID